PNERGPESPPPDTKPYKGSPLNPFTWPEACEKFRRYTATILRAPQAAAIIDAVGALEHSRDVADVACLIASAPGAAPTGKGGKRPRGTGEARWGRRTEH